MPAAESTPDIPGLSGRNALYDNAKAVLIALVVIGHAIAPLRSEPLADAFYVWIYTFHMPAIILVSGALSRTYRGSPRQLGRAVGTLLVPYLIFQILHEALRTVVNGSRFAPDPLVPMWTLWFLLALLAWRLLTPLIQALRFPLAFAVAVSLVAGVSAALDQTLSAARILGFLPFFVLGLVLRPEHLAVLRRPALRVAGGTALALGLAAAVVLHDRVPVSVLYMDRPYVDMGFGLVEGAAVRGAHLLVAAAASLALLAVLPDRRTRWTWVGMGTLYVYLLHALVLYPFRDDELPRLASPAGLVVVTVGATALALVLASPPVRRLTRWLVEPPVGALLRREEPATGRTAPTTPVPGPPA